MCYDEVLKECRKEARRNGLKLVPERMAGLYSVADTDTSTSEDTPNTLEYVAEARAFIAGLSRKELKDFGHDEINGADEMIVALHTIELLAQYNNAAAWECYGDFMESNLCGVSFKIES